MIISKKDLPFILIGRKYIKVVISRFIIGKSEYDINPSIPPQANPTEME